MSDNFLHIITGDPSAEPLEAGVLAVAEFVKTHFAPEEIRISSSPKPQLIIGGEIEHVLLCPVCGQDHQPEFFEAFGDIYSEGGFDMVLPAPCNGSLMSIADITFTCDGRPSDDLIQTAGFSRLDISCRNPRSWPKSDHVTAVSELLGSPVKFVQVHL